MTPSQENTIDLVSDHRKTFTNNTTLDPRTRWNWTRGTNQFTNVCSFTFHTSSTILIVFFLRGTSLWSRFRLHWDLLLRVFVHRTIERIYRWTSILNQSLWFIEAEQIGGVWHKSREIYSIPEREISKWKKEDSWRSFDEDLQKPNLKKRIWRRIFSLLLPVDLFAFLHFVPLSIRERSLTDRRWCFWLFVDDSFVSRRTCSIDR